MKVFMTQDEKISNKVMLDFWTLKTQIKSFLIEKKKIFAQQFKKNEFLSLM